MALFNSSFAVVSRVSRIHTANASKCFQRYATNTAKNGVPQNAGHTVEKLEGVYDNAFNRERLAVKKHAAETAGTKGFKSAEASADPE